jgi:hypothetical protein
VSAAIRRGVERLRNRQRRTDDHVILLQSILVRWEWVPRCSIESGACAVVDQCTAFAFGLLVLKPIRQIDSPPKLFARNRVSDRLHFHCISDLVYERVRCAAPGQIPSRSVPRWVPADLDRPLRTPRRMFLHMLRSSGGLRQLAALRKSCPPEWVVLYRSPRELRLATTR